MSPVHFLSHGSIVFTYTFNGCLYANVWHFDICPAIYHKWLNCSLMLPHIQCFCFLVIFWRLFMLPHIFTPRLFLCRTAHGRLVMSWKMHWCHISNENCSIILCIIPQKGTLGTSLLLCITVNKTDENLFSPPSICYGGEYFFMADSPYPVDFEIHFSWSEAWSMVIYIWSACNKKHK